MHPYFLNKPFELAFALKKKAQDVCKCHHGDDDNDDDDDGDNDAGSVEVTHGEQFEQTENQNVDLT